MNRTRSTVIAVVVFGLALAVVWIVSPRSDDRYLQQIETWHQGRVERLTSDTGYLTLVGLYPLTPGIHTFGSDPESDFVFPAGASARAGAFIVDDDGVRVRAGEGAVITAGGEPVSEMALVADVDEGETTVLEMGRLDFFLIQRGDVRYIRVRDPESKWRKEFAGLDRYPVDERWRITGRFEPYDPPKKVMVPDVLAAPRETECPGAIVFELDGRTYRLEPFARTSERDFFVVFGDETNGVDTYGGGRFVYCGPEETDGTIVIDFNKAYNPPCAFTPHTTCPLPTETNTLSLRVEAGEKAYAASH